MPNSGVYVLWLHLSQRATITVGRLGIFTFPPVFTPMLAVPSATSSSELPGTAGWKRRCTGMLIISGPRQVFWVYPSFLKPPRPGNAAVLRSSCAFQGPRFPRRVWVHRTALALPI